jgi:hypothetical protein
VKKAVSVALFGGLMIFVVPQAASAVAGRGRPVVVQGESAGEAHDAGCSTMTQGSPEQSKQDPPGEGRSHYDREHHDGDAVLN